MAIKAFAFDAYGTLFDIQSAMARHRDEIGSEAEAFATLWRAKQLEYTWTRSLMDRYADFWALTQEALDFTLARFPKVDRALRQPLLDAYLMLSAYPDVPPVLKALVAKGYRLGIFTNGTASIARSAAGSAGIGDKFETIVSVDTIRRFKTAPEAYALLHEVLALKLGEVALISSNRWDIAGAHAFGMPSFWINRTGQLDEYLDLAPTRELASIADILSV